MPRTMAGPLVVRSIRAAIYRIGRREARRAGGGWPALAAGEGGLLGPLVGRPASPVTMSASPSPLGIRSATGRGSWARSRRSIHAAVDDEVLATASRSPTAAPRLGAVVAPDAGSALAAARVDGRSTVVGPRGDGFGSKRDRRRSALARDHGCGRPPGRGAIVTRLSDEELRRLRFDLESELVERKRTGGDRSSIRRTICAFANDLHGYGRPGVILIGVEDDGRCAQLRIDDEFLRTLAQMRSDGNILPLPSMSVERRVLDGCPVAVIAVEPSSGPPVRYQGRTWVRVGPTVREATPEEERRLAERRRAGDLPFDLRPAPEASLEDLDLDYLEGQYLPRAVAAEVLEGNGRPLEERLWSLRLARGRTPVFGAILGFGRDPQAWLPGAYVQFLRFDGTALTDPVRDQKVLTGRLEDVLRRLDELLELSVSVRTTIAGPPREVREPDYPVAALQQLARNAVMHCSYEGTNSPVRVHWYSDRVEIISPGGLYGQVTPDNFGRGATDYRNPLVAEIMHHLGFAQRFGVGIPLARRALAENGNPEPEFAFQPTYVIATLRPA